MVAPQLRAVPNRMKVERNTGQRKLRSWFASLAGNRVVTNLPVGRRSVDGLFRALASAPARTRDETVSRTTTSLREILPDLNVEGVLAVDAPERAEEIFGDFNWD